MLSRVDDEHRTVVLLLLLPARFGTRNHTWEKNNLICCQWRFLAVLYPRCAEDAGKCTLQSCEGTKASYALAQIFAKQS